MNFLNKNELIWNLKMLCPISSLSKIFKKSRQIKVKRVEIFKNCVMCIIFRLKVHNSKGRAYSVIEMKLLRAVSSNLIFSFDYRKLATD